MPTARAPRSRAGRRTGPRVVPALRRPLPARRAVAEGVAAEPEAPPAPVPPVALPAPAAPEAAKKALREAAGYALLPPWKRVKRGSCLRINIGGAVTEVKQPAGPLPGAGGAAGVCLPEVCDSLVKAAHDTRITGVLLDIAPLGGGWAKLTEIRRHIEYFRTSGKVGSAVAHPPRPPSSAGWNLGLTGAPPPTAQYCIAYLDTGGEKEYYLASAAEEIYVPPQAYVGLTGLSVEGSFLRGVLDKLGRGAGCSRRRQGCRGSHGVGGVRAVVLKR